ncbi:MULTISPECIES: hypothetical protein [Flavobacterium]|uniref:Uncharacterized protein n=1 Tax=Flavobacterium hankyongi TaxID=1176532 RepID=A0ABP9A8W0_9FLAO|nr:hypothetical protein [Flavobacterium sp. N1846]
MTEKDFIRILLDKSKDIRDGIFIPNEVTIKISELDDFDVKIAEKLSKEKGNVFSKIFGNENGIYRRDNYTKTLIQYSIEENYITFFPSILKSFINEK